MTIRPATDLIAAYTRLLRHERKHLEQIERDGRAVSVIKYLWWTIRRRCWQNPYEIEARAAEWKKLMTPDERKALICEIVEGMQPTKPQPSDEEMQCVRLDSNKRRL